MTSAQLLFFWSPYPLITVTLTQPISIIICFWTTPPHPGADANVIYGSYLKYELATDVSREDFDAAVTPELVVKPGKGVPVYLKRRTDIVE